MASLVQKLRFVRDDADEYLLQQKARGTVSVALNRFLNFSSHSYAAVDVLEVTRDGFDRLWKYVYPIFEYLCKDAELCELWNPVVGEGGESVKYLPRPAH